MELTHSPEHYAALAREAEKRQHWASAETLWVCARSVSIGHTRRERYSKAAQQCNYNRARMLARMQTHDGVDAQLMLAHSVARAVLDLKAR